MWGVLFLLMLLTVLGGGAVQAATVNTSTVAQAAPGQGASVPTTVPTGNPSAGAGALDLAQTPTTTAAMTGTTAATSAATGAGGAGSTTPNSNLNIGSSCGAAGTQCLPLWRWGTPHVWTHQGGARVELGNGWLGQLSQMFLAIGGAMWWLLRSLMGLAAADGWIDSFLVRTNEIFLTVADFLIADTPLFGFVLIAGLIGAVSLLFKRGVGGGMFTQLITFALPLALLLSFVSAARTGTSAPAGTTVAQQAAQLPTGSPAWIAKKGVDMVEGVTDGTVTRLMGVSGSFEPAQANGAIVEVDNPGVASKTLGCEPYIDHLYESSGADATLVALSKFYELSYLRNFYQVQYGDIATGEAIGCRLLETDDAGIPPDAQARFMKSASPVATMPAQAYIALNEEPDDALREVMAWGICTGPGHPWLIATEGPEAAADCATWRTTGDWHDAETAGGTKAGEVASAYAAAAAVNSSQAVNEYNTYLSLTQRRTSLLGALMAMITGVVFLFTMGGLALGSALAGVILVAMLMMLPVTLLALALPKTRPMGSKLMAWTGGAVFAKLAMTVLLTLMLFLTDITNTVMSGLGGTLSVILVPAVPLLIWFIMRKILQKIGMGGLMTMKGGLNATGAVAGKIESGSTRGGSGGGRKQRGMGSQIMRTSAVMGGVRMLKQHGADFAKHHFTKGARAETKARRRALRADPESGERIAREAAAYRIQRLMASGEATDDKGNVIETEDGRVVYKAEQARRKEIGKKDILVGRGVTVPKPVINGVNRDAADHWVNYLPDELKERRRSSDGVLETEEEWANRLNTYGDVLAVQDMSGDDTWSAVDSLTKADAAAVQGGNLKPLSKVPHFKLSTDVVQAAERGAGIRPEYQTSRDSSRWSHRRRVRDKSRKVDPNRFATADALARGREEARKANL